MTVATTPDGMNPAQAAARPEPFAVYLAKQLVARKGYGWGTVPEAEELLSACDIVLTRSDGISFHIVCIVDCEANPSKQFGASKEKLESIGRECLKYTGTINGTKFAVGIQIYEVGNTAITEADKSRLQSLRRRMPGRAKVVLSSWRLDTSSASVWTTALFGVRWSGRGFLGRLMREPRVTDEKLFQPQALIRGDVGRPALTYSILAVLLGVFVVEHVFAVEPMQGLLAPGIGTLVALGGLNRTLVVESREWYRLLTAAFLHGDILHLVMNGVALLFAGLILEGLLGRAWLLALFITGAIGGSLMSLAVNAVDMVSVGASGAIMGLTAAAFISAFRLPHGAARTRIQMSMMRVLIPSLIPLATHRTGQNIDFGAHLGGAMTGALMGYVLLRTWPRQQPLPRFRGFAKTISLVGTAVILFGAFQLFQHHRDFTLANFLIPDDQLPTTDDDAKSRSADLVAQFPRDPRSHLFRAVAYLSTNDLPNAEQQLKAGLSEKEILQKLFVKLDLEIRLRTILAAVLVDQGKSTEAKDIAQPVCKAGQSGEAPEQLKTLGVCSN